MNPDNYYKLLGISKNANEQDVKKAYYKLAKKWHPDKNNSIDAEEHFKRVKVAYETLINPNARRKYDLNFEPEPKLNPNMPKESTTNWKKSKFFRPESREKKTFQKNQSFFSDRENQYFKNESNFFSRPYSTNQSNNRFTSSKIRNNQRPKWNNKWTENETNSSNQIFFDENLSSPFDIFEQIIYFKLFENLIGASSRENIDSFSEFTSALNQDKTKSNTNLPRMRDPINRKKEEKLEFEWLGQTSRKKKAFYDLNYDKEASSDDESDKDSVISSSSNSRFKSYFDSHDVSLHCYYCFRELSNRESLKKHESVCKRLSHNIKKQSHTYGQENINHSNSQFDYRFKTKKSNSQDTRNQTKKS